MNDKFLTILNIIALAATLTTNFLAIYLPINGISTAAISDKYLNLFTPAGYTFSIWSIIYISQLAMVIYLLALAFRPNKLSTVPWIINLGWWYIIACGINILWIFSWHYELLYVSLILMVCLLAVLINLYQRLFIGKLRIKIEEQILIHLPISLYLGWISVATIANFAVFLTGMEWDGSGLEHDTWFGIMTAVVGLLAMFMAITRKDFIFIVVILWALMGIRYQLMTRNMEYLVSFLYIPMMIVFASLFYAVLARLRKVM